MTWNVCWSYYKLIFERQFFYNNRKKLCFKKVTYGWDSHNNEAYNKTKLLRSFLNNNGMQEKTLN